MAILSYSVIRAACWLSLNNFGTFGYLAVYLIETAIGILSSKYLISIIDEASFDIPYDVFIRLWFISVTTYLWLI